MDGDVPRSTPYGVYISQLIQFARVSSHVADFDYAPQYFYTDRSKAVLLLWFLTVTCSCCPYLYFGLAIMLVTYFVNFWWLNDHLFGKELFIRFTASAFRKLPSIYVFNYFPFGFEGRMWDLIVSVPDYCLSFYFTMVLR